MRILILGFLVTGLSGCLYLKTLVGMGPQRPKVSIEKVDYVSLSAKTLKLNLKLKVYNPNDFDLELANASYELSNDGEQFAKGSHKKELVAVKKAYSLVSLPIGIDLKSTGTMLKKMLITGKKPLVKWLVQAEFQGPFGAVDVEFEDEKPLY